MNLSTANVSLGLSSLGTLTLSGGTLNVPAVTPGSGSGTFNFNGGVLQAGTTARRS